LNRATWIRVGLTAFLSSVVASCGGYGAPSGGAHPPRLVLSAPLSGAEETSVVDAAASGTAILDLHEDGALTFAVTGEPSWVTAVTGLELHRGFAGENGPTMVNLFLGGATFDPATATATGSLSLDPTLADEILGLPGYYYVQVLTGAAPQGLVRGQLGINPAREIHAVLHGSEQTVVVDAASRGAATLAIGSDLSLHYVIAMATPAVGTLALGHVHAGPVGTDGPVILDLLGPSATVDAAAGTIIDDLVMPVPVLCRMLQDLPSFYVNVHTALAPLGIARGQARTGTEGLWATLSGSEELTVIDAAARGGCTIEMLSFTAGEAVHAVPPTQSIASVTDAAVRLGGFGATGATVLDLRAGAGFAVDAATGMAAGPVALDQTLYTRLLGNPDAFHVNLVTAAAPAGLVRGQLTQNAATFRALLSGAEETVVLDPAASGAVRLLVTGVHAASFDVDMTSPGAATLIGAHTHGGATGVNGPILIDFLAGTNVVTIGDRISGDVAFAGRTFAGLLASPELYYANVHTIPAPAGIARGQYFRVTDSAPPTGLGYSTPVVYATGVAIAPNVPFSGGGAVLGYTVAPALPAGLSLHATTGIFSGTPTATSASTVYTVTASNTAGSTTATVNITVNVAAPAGLSYTTPSIYVVGTAITPNSPASTGGPVASYGVSPALPAGLSLHTTTGVISGTPTVVASATDHVVTATNVSGSTTATVNMRVDASLTAPTGLSYSTPVTYTTGTAITANSPTISGGAVASWSVSPALPAGLSLSTTTGVISGTPTAVASAATYTVTATNGAGNTTGTVNITVNLGAPTNLTYSNDPNLGYVTPPSFFTMNPSSDGGAVASYSITPALPAGISLNTTTGVVSGTPTATSAQTTYTVTATNATGSTTASIVITIL